MKKFYAILSALLLCGASSQAAINVSLVKSGDPVEDGATLTVNKDEFTHLYYPGILDKWTGQIDVNVVSDAPTQVKLSASCGSIMFCPVGENCYTLSQVGPFYSGSGTLSSSNIDIPIDINYYDCGENLPEANEYINVRLTDKSGATFSFKVVFDSTNDAAVEGIEDDADASYDVYTVAGLQVVKDASVEAVKALPAGLYIVNGKKVIIK